MINEVNYARDKFYLVQQDTEIVPLLEFLKKEKIDSFIEIGTHKGGSFYLLSKLCSGLKISIDLCSGEFGGIGFNESSKRNEKLGNLFNKTYFIEGDTKSTNTLIRLSELLEGKKVDLLFIDGDHTYEGVKNDWMNYKTFVKLGGFVVFHDIVDTEFHRSFNPPCMVSQLWNEIKQKETVTEFICEEHLRKWDGGGIGLIKIDK